MRKIDLNTWSRREHFEFFKEFNHPHYSICANVDLTQLYPFIKAHGYSITAAIIYVIARAANAVPEFRYRLREGEVVEHETVSPSVTILVANDLFSFCAIDYSPDFAEFASRASHVMAAVKENPTLKDPPGRDDLLYMTALPWIAFTSFTHPMRLHPADSIPRFAWGKYFQEGERLKMPLNVQGHHALIDGIHMGRFYAAVEEILLHPEQTMGET
jgi:chloramphenicol O-acetyltransferase type A